MTDAAEGPPADAGTIPGKLAENWPRLWARLFDTGLNLMVVALLSGVLFPELFASSVFVGAQGNMLLGVMLIPVALLVDALIQGLLGNTLGKRLCGIGVERINGGPLTVAFAGRRNLRIYLEGFILGLPLIMLYGFARANDRLSRKGATSWDEALGTRVVDRRSHILRTVLVAVLALSLSLGGEIYSRWAEAMTPQWEREYIVSGLPEANRGLPHFLDDITRYDRVDYTVQENILTFDHRFIHRDASPVSAEEIPPTAQMRAARFRDYCAPALAYYRERKIPVRYRYRHDDQRLAQEHFFDKPAMCPA